MNVREVSRVAQSKMTGVQRAFLADMPRHAACHDAQTVWFRICSLHFRSTWTSQLHFCSHDLASEDNHLTPAVMDDETAARALIQEIRRNKGVDEPGGFSELALDLENSTRLLSEDLYSTPTRFLLELLQNADDNVYENGRVLRVSIVYRSDGYLWVGSNEGGFLPENVKTICRIHASTKRVIGGRKGYIGEKGIGFKSVFKVANVVSVKSGALQVGCPAFCQHELPLIIA